MKIKQSRNGNLESDNRFGIISTVLINPESRDWYYLNNLNTLQSQLSGSSRYTEVKLDNLSTYIENFGHLSNTSEVLTSDSEDTQLVYNREYVNKENQKNLLKSLDRSASVTLDNCDSFIVSSETLNDNSTLPAYVNDEERVSDNRDMHNKVKKAVPRGIVNPNYPGFQHFAHTLQEYTTPGETSSDNDMTDDDNDVEITDISSYTKNHHEVLDNNNAQHDYTSIQTNDAVKENEDQMTDVQATKDLPDLLKNVNKNSSVDNFYCDIENNFDTHDIIGDFNKELEAEIKQLLNYNLNINDDIEELKKDIKDNFSKPIENTINNISDVVNHVIKKLVETQSEVESEISRRRDSETVSLSTLGAIYKESVKEDSLEMNRDSARPTFLLLENNFDPESTDAVLSDGKDELNVTEEDYNADFVVDIETTIKQLSTELRKFIPKLEEMRDSSSLGPYSTQCDMINRDRNCNQIDLISPRNHLNCAASIEPVRNKEENKINLLEKNTETAKIRHVNYRSKVTRSPRERKNYCISTGTVHKSISREDSDLGGFDVYNIETALPDIDLDAIESHIKAAKDAERRKRNDREEIRKRLAMGAEAEEYYSLGHIDRPGRKPSLQSRLQSGMNLQICFMNETASDNESQMSDIEKSSNSNSRSLSRSSIFSKSNFSLNNHPYQTRPLSVNITKNDKISTVQSGGKLRPSILSTKSTKSRSTHSLSNIEIKESDFFALQATLQTEARIALAQAKEMARIQMERERRARPESPVTSMLRGSMEKAGVPLPPDRRRVSRHLLTDMNLAQLQVIVNELHSQIESLNEQLVRLLLARDDLHMGQDSMLVDIEDLTRYLGVKEQSKKTKGVAKSATRRLASLVHK